MGWLKKISNKEEKNKIENNDRYKIHYQMSTMAILVDIIILLLFSALQHL